MKLTNVMIEELATDIENFLRKNEMLSDVCIYFNNKRKHWYTKWTGEELELVCKEEEDISPLNYFEYANPMHILSMSFEGPFYEVMNGWRSRDFKLQDKFQKILDKYSVYYELGSSWNLSCFPSKDDMEIEFTTYQRPKQRKELYVWDSSVAPELRTIMDAWYTLSEAEGEKGSCVIGAGFKFTWKDDDYFMNACSPYQGSLSWEAHKNAVELMLKGIGAESICYNWGRMD